MYELPPLPEPAPPPYIGKNWKTEVRTQLLQLRFFHGEHKLFTEALKKWRERNGIRGTTADFVREMVWPTLYDARITVSYLELERPELKALRSEPKRAGEDRDPGPTKIQVVLKVSPLDLATIRWKQFQSAHIRSQNILVMSILLPQCLRVLLQPDDVDAIRARQERERKEELERAMNEVRENLSVARQQLQSALNGVKTTQTLTELATEIEKLEHQAQELIAQGAIPGALHGRNPFMLVPNQGAEGAAVKRKEELDRELDNVKTQLASKRAEMQSAITNMQPADTLTELAAAIETLENRAQELIDQGGTTGALHGRDPYLLAQKKRGRPVGSKNKPKATESSSV